MLPPTPPTLPPEQVPALVQGDITIDLRKYGDVLRNEWDQLREHDVVFLVTIRMKEPATDEDGDEVDMEGEGEDDMAKDVSDDMSFPSRYGITYVRGAEVVRVRDGRGRVMNDLSGKPEERSRGDRGSRRTLTVRLDPAQYQQVKATTLAGQWEHPCMHALTLTLTPLVPLLVCASLRMLSRPPSRARGTCTRRSTCWCAAGPRPTTSRLCWRPSAPS